MKSREDGERGKGKETERDERENQILESSTLESDKSVQIFD